MRYLALLPILLITFFFSPFSVMASDTLFEQQTADNDWVNPWGANENSQPFVASSDHSVTSIKLKLFKSGAGGTMTADIATDNAGNPGTVLGSSTFDCSTLGTGTGGTIQELTGYTNVNLVSGTTYHIVLHGPNPNCSVRAQGSSGVTPVLLFSSNSGSSWTTGQPDQLWYQIYGIGSVAAASGPAFTWTFFGF